MKETGTNIAIGHVAGMPAVITAYRTEREPLKNECITNENAYLKFINAQNLPDLLTAVDALLDELDCTFLFTDLVTTRDSIEALDASSAKEICAFFDIESPTRTTLNKTKEAIKAWSFLKARPKVEGITDEEFEYTAIPFTPIEDLVKAAEDLRRTSLLLAYLLGKTDLATAHGQRAGDTKAKMRTLTNAEPKFIHEYYEQLRTNTGNIVNGFGIYSAVSRIHLCDELTAKKVISDYVQAAFTVLMSDEREVMSNDLKVCKKHGTVLSAAWAYFAKGLIRDDGPGAIAVCKHCGKFYEQQRSTRVYCSDSCRVMALRKSNAEKQ